jgi:DedD protein
MEKEQKKLLLVAVSVGVFLLVTITAGIVVMTSKINSEETAFAPSRPYPAGLQPVQDINAIVPLQPAQISQETNINIDTDTGTAPAVTAVTDINDGDSLTISIPKPTTAAVPDSPEIIPAPVSRPVATVAPVKTAPATQSAPAATTQRAPAAQPATVTVKPATSATRTASPSPSPLRPKTTNDYWVQTGAFSAQVRAEDAKETLASTGMTSIIENRQIDGKTWYRVRLGPYTSEKEASYWLALVKSIDGFGESQIRQTVRQQ